MTLLPCAGVLCPLLSDPLIWQLHGVLKHLAQQMTLNNCSYKHITNNLKSHTENANIANHAGKKKYSTEANTQTTSRQNLLSDMHRRPEFSQSALPTYRKLRESKLLPTCLSGQILLVYLNEAGLNTVCLEGSPCRAGSSEIWALSFSSKRSLPFILLGKMRTQNCDWLANSDRFFFVLTGLETFWILFYNKYFTS